MTRTNTEQGSVLVITLTLVILLGALAAGLFQVTTSDQSRTELGLRATRATYIAEAGAAHSILDLVALGDGVLGSEAAPVAFGGGGFWSTAATVATDTWRVQAWGRSGDLVRAFEIFVAPEYSPVFAKALFGDLDLGATGHVFTDSYDSELGTYASQAVNVDPVSGETYAAMGGSLGSNGNIIVSGGVTILGDASPGPGRSVILSGGPAYIAGSTAPMDKRAPLPPPPYEPPIVSAGNLSLTTTLILPTGEYRFGSLTASANAVLRISGDVVLYLDGDLSFTGKAKIVVDSGASLTIFHNGSDFKLTGGGSINEDERPSKLVLYSNATSVKVGGNASFYGGIYAPAATIDPGGTSDIFGSFVGRQVSVNGAARFHYDEDLRDAPLRMTDLIPVSWRKISSASVGVAP